MGSHNSWSYLPVKKWWMKPIAFTARCQSVDIRTQYEMGVRCFDLRIRKSDDLDDLSLAIAHGIVEYVYDLRSLEKDLDFLEKKGDCYVRVIHEARNKRQYNDLSLGYFHYVCKFRLYYYDNIRFWCGRNLYNWEKDYDFGEDPSCDEKYASVCKPRLIDDWWPWLYAKLHNRKIRKKGTDKDILLIDYVNIR